MHIKISFAVVGLLVAAPVLALAQQNPFDTTDLQAQIRALSEQVRLNTQIVPVGSASNALSDDYPGAGAAAPACPHLTLTMKRGARDATTGGQVSDLQAFLAGQFNLDEETLVGGYFGTLTENYVKRFQTKYGLPTYGIAGSLTRAKIAEVCGGLPTVSIPAPIATNIPSPVGGKCGIANYRVDSQCGESSYQRMYATCQDGTKVVQGGETSCKPASTWIAYAESACANRCSLAEKNVTNIEIFSKNPSGQAVSEVTIGEAIPLVWTVSGAPKIRTSNFGSLSYLLLSLYRERVGETGIASSFPLVRQKGRMHTRPAPVT